MDEPDRRTVPATWPWWVLVATLLAVAWLRVHLAGGTRTALRLRRCSSALPASRCCPTVGCW